MINFKTYKPYYPPFRNGYVAISSVLIVSLVALVVSTTITMLSINEGQSAWAITKSEDTLNFVEGCAEDALAKLRSNNSYGGGTITRPEGTCSIVITGGSGPWTISATTTASDYKKTVTIIVAKIGNQLKVSSWTEN